MAAVPPPFRASTCLAQGVERINLVKVETVFCADAVYVAAAPSRSSPSRAIPAFGGDGDLGSEQGTVGRPNQSIRMEAAHVGESDLQRCSQVGPPQRPPLGRPLAHWRPPGLRVQDFGVQTYSHVGPAQRPGLSRPLVGGLQGARLRQHAAAAAVHELVQAAERPASYCRWLPARLPAAQAAAAGTAASIAARVVTSIAVPAAGEVCCVPEGVRAPAAWRCAAGLPLQGGCSGGGFGWEPLPAALAECARWGVAAGGGTGAARRSWTRRLCFHLPVCRAQSPSDGAGHESLGKDHAASAFATRPYFRHMWRAGSHPAIFTERKPCTTSQSCLTLAWSPPSKPAGVLLIRSAHQTRL